MTAKHTPAPWAAAQDPDNVYMTAINGKNWWSLATVVTRLMDCPLDHPEGIANAHLIAAAPDMLEALKNIENDGNQVPPHAWALIQAAIAKAEGGKP